MPPEQESAAPREEKRDPGDEKTALIPASLCPDMQPGDEVTLKIVAVHEDEYEVSYSPKGNGDEEEHKAGGEPSMSRASEGNNSMAYMS